MNARVKDSLRNIHHERKRFISLVIITMLGVIVMTGLKASCDDLRISADLLFDEQKLFDIRVQSTLGLTEEDVEALAALPGVELAEGSYTEAVYTNHGDMQQTATMKLISANGVNNPYIVSGNLPAKADEIAVTSKYLSSTGKKIGDTVYIEEKSDDTSEDTNSDSEETAGSEESPDDEFTIKDTEETPNYLITEYTITAEVIDPADINASEGVVSFRSTAATDYTFFILPEAVTYDIYSEINLRVSGAAALSAYSEEYETKIAEITDSIEKTIKARREAARTDSIRAEAEQKLQDARAEADEKLADAEKEILDAEAELIDGQKKLDDGTAELMTQEADALKAFEEAYAQIEDGYAQLEEGQKALDEARTQFELQSSYMTSEMIAQYTLGFEAQQAELDGARAELDSNKSTLDTNKASALLEIANAKAEIEENRKKLDDGFKELDDAKKEFLDKKQEVLDKFADAQKDIDDIETAIWYISDRTALSGFANVKSDSDSIEAIGRVFPIVFLIVAVLISLTTSTRMVEESRGMLGTYKALGFTDFQIRKKYTLFAVSASLIGGFLGDIGGFVLLPKFIFTIFATMYQIPEFYLSFSTLPGIGGIALFTICIYAATYWSVRGQLKTSPAILMRPTAPIAGKKIFLEKIPFIWKRMSFLNKVTARNIFRYKKRLFMTICGIMGCTALLICGFAIKDSVADLLPGQYENIYLYDTLVVSKDADTLYEALDKENDIKDWQKIYTTNVKVTGPNLKTETVQMVVIPDNADLTPYFALKDAESGAVLSLRDSGIIVTKNLAVILEFSEHDTVIVQDLELNQSDLEIDGIVMNYLGNMVYISQTVFEKHFSGFEGNGALINLKDNCTDPIGFADRIGDFDGVINSTSTESLKEDFDTAFALINMVVYLLIGLAASLSFVVLFTLCTTNISERERELSTIKVLGFYDKEVHLYINKETLLLTVLGTLLGLPAGSVLGHALTKALNMPSIYFEVSIHSISFCIAFALSMVFSVLVCLMTGAFMDKINPIEALKSVE